MRSCSSGTGSLGDSLLRGTVQIAEAGAIPLLVGILGSKSAEAREHSAAVLSALARSQQNTKKRIATADAIGPLVELLGGTCGEAAQVPARQRWSPRRRVASHLES